MKQIENSLKTHAKKQGHKLSQGKIDELNCISGRHFGRYEVLKQEHRILHKNLCHIPKERHGHDPTKGLGKPKPLRYQLSGSWRRRLPIKDRVIYQFDDVISTQWQELHYKGLIWYYKKYFEEKQRIQ